MRNQKKSSFLFLKEVKIMGNIHQYVFEHTLFR